MADGSALVRRYIGRRFTALRNRAGLTQEKAADALQRARATVARIEDGDHRVRFRDIDVRAMLELYHATPEESEQLLALTAETRNGHRKSWLHDYTETTLPPWFALYLSLEAAAETIREYEAELVPGQLQTRAYAEQIIGMLAGYLSDEDLRHRVDLRMRRQAVLRQPRAPHLDVILNEAVLRRPVGGPVVMAAQLRHLAEATRQADISVRVVPLAVGAHGGLLASAFTLFDFPPDPRTGEPLERPLTYVDTLTNALYLNKPDEIAAYRLVWRDLSAKALDQAGSLELIDTVLRGLEQ